MVLHKEANRSKKKEGYLLRYRKSSEESKMNGPRKHDGDTILSIKD